ncbi:translation initiation factor IF-2 subunit gamma [archaeon]|nr:translation initiation factor IF-2 subunit gamma [archaeon]NCP79545.1 translation initiation factor IF-2 subunit gamma [archaeon]NCQ07312.1 translation initiation factor IF-2 subunit gamma [archaeon]NCQ51108.1 translation initiation factor IF-2 subunit gamma [archaeon]NCT58550.1 translation initiation factor IF-2 subunit gamma [archaeon]
MNNEIQAELNIGIVGHVDHGKTTLTSKLTGKWTDRHSEEIKQGISIKLGYADAEFYIDPSVSGISSYTSQKTHPLTGNKTELVRKVSFVDAPGHETLMAVMLSGAALLNGAILVVAANEECPQPRTIEHLLALKMHGIKNLVVAQNKIDLVSKEEALLNYKKLREFLDSEGYKDSPIIPTSAHFDTNIDALIYAIVNTIEKPSIEKLSSKPLKMQIVRSFDINKPSTKLKELKGGVLGGAILEGKISVNEKCFIYPGFENGPIEFKVKSLNSEKISLKEAHLGGLIAIGTDLDPFFCFSDKMVGQIVCEEKSKPTLSNIIKIDYNKIERLIEPNQSEFKIGERVVLVIGSSAQVGVIKKINKNNEFEIMLARNAAFYPKNKVAVSRNVNSRWRLAGYGEIK